MKDVDISLAGGWIEVASIVHPPGKVVVSMRPVSVVSMRALYRRVRLVAIWRRPKLTARGDAGP